jgi:8-oxo-dGTP pyrophosphatase MutT (NUDIX family)
MSQTAMPLPASTVVLARPDELGGFEIFMNRRPEEMDTYAGVYVFPGGRVENDDWCEETLKHVIGVTPLEAQDILGGASAPERCLGHWVAAARELFEEAGIHMFVSEFEAKSPFMSEALFNRLAQKRSALQLRELNFRNLLREEKLLCDLGRLRYFFHRVTPERYPIRFDTRFYLAALPAGQTPLDVSEEVSESLWISPMAALERHQAGTFAMMPPTITVLHNLLEQPTWTGLCNRFHLQ